ncbi:MAG: ActS/PrrB/RegB family redox-sensitive histidine kinase [Cohaesibacter sp.]|jgi:two-component system sensor histidine kinase RegB|nr:ActS/PrrB/RegB family redox-sensitive histidine kinase [Cohaesibacter sp.]
MVTSSLSDPSFGNRQIKLNTLVRLRWLAILGQTIAVLFVYLVLGYNFEAWLCLALVGLSAWLNFYLQFHFRKYFRLKSEMATALLAYDSCQLGGLLYLTGGLQNPFALLLLVPAVVSATTQPARFTIFLSALITLIATLLIWFYQPLPWAMDRPPQLPLFYIIAIWISIVVTMGFLSIYAYRVAQEGQLLADALSATELVLAKEQHLSNLDGLATAAAHELGTPLATITLVSKELEREILPDDPIYDDILLLRTQSERCREILGKLRSLSSSDDATFSKMRLKALIAEVCSPFEGFGVAINQTFPPNLEHQPVLLRNPGLLYGLSNLIENAVDFAQNEVDISVSWTDSEISLRLMDDGPGFSPEIMDQLGDPYITSRAHRYQSMQDEGGEDGAASTEKGAIGGGLGLGFFIAKTLLERTGAKVSISNRQKIKKQSDKKSAVKTIPKTGAIIQIVWTRAELEADQYKRSKFDARLSTETE